ncbi:MAG TPA: hypothetical protein VHQ65_01605 [Thermoanaerobaculia bacterium]|nr:hypothetical protein [Thermoanaerobaculia bacterium]
MRSTYDPNPPIPPLPGASANAFAPQFLARLDPEDDPITATEAAWSGPWQVEARPAGGWSVVRALGADEEPPAAVLRHRQAALLTAAALPVIARCGHYRLESERGAQGYRLYARGLPAGHLPWYHEELVTALDLLDALVRSPDDLATVLEAAGPSALRLTGAVLGERG